MNLETFDSGDTKRQIFIKGSSTSEKQRQNLASKTNCGEYFVPGKRIQLDQFGQELLDAENHCNQLKAELLQFRKDLPVLCKNLGDTSPESPRDEYVQREHIPVKDVKENQPIVTKSYVPPPRQTSQYISTDTTGAAVVTINNILNGITESVNRLSHLHSHLGQNFNPVSEQVSPEEQIKIDMKEREKVQSDHLQEQGESSNPSLLEEIPICNPEVKMKPKESPKRKKAKLIKQRIVSNQLQDSAQAQRKMVKVTAKRVDKKSQLHTVKTSMILRDSRSTVVSRRRRLGTIQPSINTIKNALNNDRNDSFASSKVLKNTTAKLVELYHNKAAKTSDSDDEEDGEKKNKRKPKPKPAKTETDIVPPLDINNEKLKHFQNMKELTEAEKQTDYQEPAAPRTQCSVLSRSYELPTIASKLKEVAKTYLHAFNFHMIPFCPAASTSPSHNIGINIQQVLNLIKTKQPVCSISPTLAHNIGLAAEKLNSQPLHALVSTLSSRMTYGRSQCPLLRNNLNYQQLSELAKDLPEEDGTDEQAVSNEGQNFEEPTKDLPGNKGQITWSTEQNKQLGNKGQLMWSTDPNKQVQCTCVPTQGVGFKQVLHKYSNANVGNYSCSDYHVKQQANPNNTPVSSTFLKARNKKLASSKRPYRFKERDWIKPMKTSSLPQNVTLNENAMRKRTLKEVLQNLHDEFDALNRKYEVLSRQITDNKSEANNDALKELEAIEKELAMKEEEINMVVALYKEVAALKEQVKNLKKRASQSSITVNPKPAVQTMNSSQAALHLTKLLRQIQNIQNQCSKSKA